MEIVGSADVHGLGSVSRWCIESWVYEHERAVKRVRGRVLLGWFEKNRGARTQHLVLSPLPLLCLRLSLIPLFLLI